MFRGQDFGTEQSLQHRDAVDVVVMEVAHQHRIDRCFTEPLFQSFHAMQCRSAVRQMLFLGAGVVTGIVTVVDGQNPAAAADQEMRAAN